MVNKDFFQALIDLEEQKGINKDYFIESLEAALTSAYKKNFGEAKSAFVKLNPEKNSIKIYSYKTVVDEVLDPDKEISLVEAKTIKKSYKVGDVVQQEETPKTFGRIAAQTAKQVIIQKLREAEREIVYTEFNDRKGEIVSGLVQKADHNIVVMDLGKLEGVMPSKEQIPTEKYHVNDKVKGYDFTLLKQHSFFNVKSTTNIEEITKNLIIKSNFAISMKNKNANIPQCIFEQDRKSSEISSQPSLLSDSSNNSESISKSMMSSMYQDPNGDKVIKAGKLKKRSPYFYYDLRKVILFDTPRLDYFEPETKMRKGSIPLNKECKAELVKNNQFLLKTPSRTYSFMCKEKYDITPWVVAINKAIEDCLLKESNGESRVNV